MSRSLGSTFGPYEIIDFLGQSELVEFYQARLTTNDRLARLEVLPNAPNTDALFAQRFTRHARAVAGLRHPNIPELFDFGPGREGMYFLALEQMEGETLADRLEKTPFLPLAEVVAIIEVVAGALSAAHQAGVVHRDLHPGHVTFSQRGEIILSGFELGRLLEDEALVPKGQVLGMVEYMAPEVARGYAGDPLSDIYSLGILLYQLLAGRLPFQSRDPQAVIAAHMGTTAWSPRQFNPQISDEVAEISLSAMEKTPDRRFQSAERLATLLRETVGTILAHPPRTRCRICQSDEIDTERQSCLQCGFPLGGGGWVAATRCDVCGRCISPSERRCSGCLTGVRVCLQCQAPNPLLHRYCLECRAHLPSRTDYQVQSPDFQTPGELVAADTLRKLPYYNAVRQYVTGYVIRPWLEGTIFPQASQVGPNNYPDIYNIAQYCAARLNLAKLPAIFIYDGPEASGATRTYGASDDPYLFITSAVARSATAEQLKMLLAHEMGHVKARHVINHTIIELIRSRVVITVTGATHLVPVLRQIDTPGAVLPYLASYARWASEADYTADRAALVVAPDVELFKRTFAPEDRELPPMVAPGTNAAFQAQGGRNRLDARVRQATEWMNQSIYVRLRQRLEQEEGQEKEIYRLLGLQPLRLDRAPNAGLPAGPPPSQPPPPGYPRTPQFYQPPQPARPAIHEMAPPTEALEVPADISRPGPAEARVMGFTVVESGRRLPLRSRSVTIGRVAIEPADIDLTAEDVRHRVSRQHARVTSDGSAYYIEDLGSRNHTYVNDELLPPHNRRLLRGAERVRIADVVLQFGAFTLDAPRTQQWPVTPEEPPAPPTPGVMPPGRPGQYKTIQLPPEDLAEKAKRGGELLPTKLMGKGDALATIAPGTEMRPVPPPPETRAPGPGVLPPAPPVVTRAYFVAPSGRHLPIPGNDVIIGRSSVASNYVADIDLANEDPDHLVSRRHVRLVYEGGTYYVEDLGSRNLTHVNDTPLPPHQRRPLRPGDVVRVARTPLTFTVQHA